MTAKDLRVRIRHLEELAAGGDIGPVAVDQAVATLLDEGQNASAVPLYFKEVLGGIKGNPRLRQHRRHKPREFGGMRIDRPMGTSQEI